MSQKQNKTTSSEDELSTDSFDLRVILAGLPMRRAIDNWLKARDAHRDKLIEARARLNLIDEFGEKQSQSSISRGDMLAYLQVMQKQAEAEIKRLEES